MNTFVIRCAFAALLCLAGFAFAESDLHDETRHRSAVAHEEHLHAHPGVDLSHPIVTESPVPETHARFDYSFADGDEGREHTVAATLEYAFTQNISVEAVLPYTFLDPDEGDSADRLGDSILAVKLATYEFVDQRFIPAVGLEVVLPTGNEERGIGSDHVVELEPFFRAGYWLGDFEFIGSFAVGIPLNQSEEEDDEEDVALAYGVSTLYHVAPSMQALVELHGESIYGDEDESALFVSPGVIFQPFPDKSISIGIGATVPVTDEEEIDYAINLMAIVHF